MKQRKQNGKKFVKAQTPEMLQKQRAAIISYYVKKRKEEAQNKKQGKH